MRLATFEVKGTESWGAVEEESVADVGRILAAQFPDLRSVIAGQALGAVRDALPRAPRHSLDAIEWQPPISRPGKILCIGLNYETHRKETGRPEAAHPAIFTRFADTLLGHLGLIPRPRVSKSLDYEGELAVVIGRAGRYIPASRALDHVAGYACFNDATLRDWQRHTHQFTPGKNFPGTGAFGPWLLTADEVSDYRNFRLTTRVNGEIVQDAGLNELIFGLPQLIEYCSSFTPLAPGNVIVTGTPGGVGVMKNPPRFLQPGEVVEVEILGIGTLRNEIGEEE